jgi:hypothetical protein
MSVIERIPDIKTLGDAVPFVGRIREIIEVIQLFEDFEPLELEALGPLHALLSRPAGRRDHSRERCRRFHGADP